MLWDWGFTWKSIKVEDAKVGINASGYGKNANTGLMQSVGVSGVPLAIFQR
jgi:hypothetical protein